MSYVQLSGIDLALAALLLVVNGVISLAFRLGLAMSFGIAAVRMAVQLAAVGFVLNFIFAQTSPLWTLLDRARHGAGRRLRAGAAPGAPLARLAGLRPRQRHAAAGRRAGHALRRGAWWCIPRPGMRRATSCPSSAWCSAARLTSCSLALQTLTEGAERERAAIEARIALGATRFEAFATVLRRALRTAITPLLNVMSVAGIVSLPGMMTGQILAGVDPAEAAKYQIMIMFVLTGASGARRLRRRLRRRAAAHRRPPPPAAGSADGGRRLGTLAPVGDAVPILTMVD